jgi:hypothetical protein
MYEVDGVFRHDDSVAFDEELTQIIRIYFIPDYFNNWVDAVSVFVFGYIIHEICLHLSTYHEEKK